MTNYTQPTPGNINLMISVNEIIKIMKPIEAMNGRYSVKPMKLIGKRTYELSENIDEPKYCKLHLESLKGLLAAPLGLVAALNECPTMTIDDKFRVELIKGDMGWEIAKLKFESELK